MGWRVVTLKYGKQLEAAFAGPDGGALREWIDACPNSLYSALVFKGGEGWRKHLEGELGHLPGIRAFLDVNDDPSLNAVMPNLAGHDMEAVLEAFHAIDDDLPTCFIAYTIKGFGLPFAGHKDNHAGLMNEEQMATFRRAMAVPEGDEWERFAGMPVPIEAVERFLAAVPFAAQRGRRLAASPVAVPDALPTGTLYDPFINRGLDALNYACYQDARFMVVATPSGITLAPEGGAHQSIGTPLIGLAQDGLASFEPGFVDELAVLMRWSFAHLQAEDGGSVYLRLSTRPVAQPRRAMTAELAADIVAGGYWLKPPQAGAQLAIAYAGAVAPEALAAFGMLLDDIPRAGLLAIPSADPLHAGWLEGLRGGGRSHAARLLEPLAEDAALVTLIDGHPATLSWLGAVARHRGYPLAGGHFRQSGA